MANIIKAVTGGIITGPTYRLGTGTTAEGAATLRRTLGADVTRLGNCTRRDAAAATRQTERLKLQKQLVEHIVAELAKQKDLKKSIEQARKKAIELGLSSEDEINRLCAEMMEAQGKHNQAQMSLAAKTAANLKVGAENGRLERQGIGREMQRAIAQARTQYGLTQGGKDRDLQRGLDERVTGHYIQNQGTPDYLARQMGTGIAAPPTRLGLAGWLKRGR